MQQKGSEGEPKQVVGRATHMHSMLVTKNTAESLGILWHKKRARKPEIYMTSPFTDFALVSTLYTAIGAGCRARCVSTFTQLSYPHGLGCGAGAPHMLSHIKTLIAERSLAGNAAAVYNAHFHKLNPTTFSPSSAC